MPVRSRRFALAGLAAFGDAIPGRRRATARLALGYCMTPRLGLSEPRERFQFQRGHPSEVPVKTPIPPKTDRTRTCTSMRNRLGKLAKGPGNARRSSKGRQQGVDDGKTAGLQPNRHQSEAGRKESVGRCLRASLAGGVNYQVNVLPVPRARTLRAHLTGVRLR